MPALDWADIVGTLKAALDTAFDSMSRDATLASLRLKRLHYKRDRGILLQRLGLAAYDMLEEDSFKRSAKIEQPYRKVKELERKIEELEQEMKELDHCCCCESDDDSRENDKDE